MARGPKKKGVILREVKQTRIEKVLIRNREIKRSKRVSERRDEDWSLHLGKILIIRPRRIWVMYKIARSKRCCYKLNK